MRLFVIIGTIVLLGCTGSTAEPQRDPSKTGRKGSDWPSFLGPNRDGVSPETGIVSPWPEEGLPIIWQTPLGEGYAAPSISNGKLYHFGRYGPLARLTCRDAQTGERQWKYEYETDYEDYYGYNGGPRCCPVVDDDRVYILGPEGQLHCVSTENGKEIWKVDTQEKFHFYQNFFGVGSTPLVEGDLLIVPVGGSPKGTPPRDFRDLKGNNSGIVAFDKKTGEVKYTCSDELASYASPIVVDINKERLGLHFARNGLLGFDPQTGKQRFHFPWRARDLESVNASKPVVVGDEVLISECYGPGAALLKITDQAYKVIWSDEDEPRDKTLQCHWNTPIYHDGYVYGCSGRHTSNAELRCVEWKTGKIMWSKPRLGRSSLMMVDGHFICLTEFGEMMLLKVNPKEYEEVSRWAVPGLDYPCWAAPVLAHGLLYVRGNDRLICMELIPTKKRINHGTHGKQKKE